MSAPYVVINDVSKSFSKEQPLALDHISARLEKGQITGIAGPDGAGKTTLIRLMAGLLKPSSGEISILGYDTIKDAKEIHRFIGYMPQKFGLYEDLSVIQNLNLFADLKGTIGDERKAAYEKLLEFTDLKSFQDRRASALSGGMKQKLGLACALLGKPKLLLLDEPSVGVDPISRRELWKMVTALIEEDIAVVWSTAYLDEVERAHTVLLLNNGKLIFNGVPGELAKRVKERTFTITNIKNNKRQVLEKTLLDKNVIDGVIQGNLIRFVAKEAASPPIDLKNFRDTGNEDLQIAAVKPRFEDAFIDIICNDPQTPAPNQSDKKNRFNLKTGSEILFSNSSGLWNASKPRGWINRSQDYIKNINLAAIFHPQELSRSSGDRFNLKTGSEIKTHKNDVIKANNLTKKYGAFTAAGNITFDVKSGEIFGLLGPNGAGKSTTFKMLCGLLKPTSGTALVDGLDLGVASSEARSQIGYMAQKFSLYGNLSVGQNLDFFSGIYNLKGREKRKIIDEMIDIFALKPFLNENADSLPLGFKQRLSLSCAVMHHPQILFLDEPTSGVDPITRREFWNHINGLVEKGITVMVTTHFMDEAEYCDRIALVYKSKIIHLGTPDALKAEAATKENPSPTFEDAFVELIKEYDRQNHAS